MADTPIDRKWLMAGAALAGTAMLTIVALAMRGMVPATSAPAPKPAPPVVKSALPAPPPPPAATVPAAKPAAAASVGAPADPTTFVLRRVLPVAGPFRHGDWLWDDKGVPAGPIVITVDLEAETLSIFRDGYEIGTAVILYGADYKPTPLGTYPITQKDADHRSNLYGGAPMPFMLRLTNDGISIHGSDVALGAATHGCIGVPTPFARKLFAAVKLGDPVIVTRGRRIEAAPSA
ncbi:L,D-transpeptidase family protein [Sphingomonas jatrophae]|uniref:Lipoprotein-anchoring transpeptidase ErfK/SrfK n=1 Tax=Sphingomonas jatrophae TaxID=1166337 RepID=A0A1I6JPS1_9SPHN|nr:L,D-transpeptidase family protein [Sphingomonas jatrophae]SFR80943.1 Lipoprotein-anchoring transpeptidase ErfK/SrfK [Sphingomonas jatrophae]